LVVVAINEEYRTGSNFIKNIFIFVPKIVESLNGLERHEGE